MAEASQLATYRTLRERLTDLHVEVAQDVPANILQAGRKKLGLSKLDMKSEEAETAQLIVLDYCLYHYQKGGRTLLEAHFEEHPPAPGSPEEQLHQALDTYRYTVFEPLGPGDETGIPVFDQLEGTGLSLMDESLGTTTQAGGIGGAANPVLAAGLIWPGDFAMTTGAVLPVTATALTRIERALRKQLGPVEEVNFETLNRRQTADVAATVITHCLREGAAQRIA